MNAEIPEKPDHRLNIYINLFLYRTTLRWRKPPFAISGLDCHQVLPLRHPGEMMGTHLPTVPPSPFITFTRTVTVNFRPRRAVYENVIVSLEDVDQGPLGTRGRVEQHGALSGVDKEDFNCSI